jgi:hypothetical protein
MVAVGRSILVIVWHQLSDPDTRFHDLGPDHFDRDVSTNAKQPTSANSRPSATGSPSNLRRENTRGRLPSPLRSVGRLSPDWSPPFSGLELSSP